MNVRPSFNFQFLLRIVLVAGLTLAAALPHARAQTTITTVDSTGDVGQYSSQAVVNGNPAISYYDVTNKSLKYVRASDASGTSWVTLTTVDSTGDVGQYASLFVVNGNPAISYYDNTNHDLKYVRASDANGTTWGTPVTLDSTGDVGQYTSLVVVNGNPAISYHDNTNGDLKYVRASDASGTSWATPVTVAGTGIDVGHYTSLAVVNGNPAISYYDNTNKDLIYVRASDTGGTSWGTPVTLDSTGDVGQFTSMAMVNGNPAISYYDNTNKDLKYVRASDASGTGWATPVTLDSTGDVGQYTSLAFVHGSPAISYHDFTNKSLKYVRASNASGTSWGTPLTLDSSASVGQYASMAVLSSGNPAISYYDNTNRDLKWVTIPFTDIITTLDSTGDVGQYTSQVVVNGNPAISYYDVTNKDLKYVRASNVTGTSWATPVTVAGTGIDVGQYTSLAVVNGNPAISYYDATNHDLKYVRASDAGGTTWGTPVTVDSPGDVGQYTSLVVVNGNPAISYYDFTNKDLKYVRASDVSGTSWGTPVTLDSTGDVGQDLSLAVVNGNPAISYYDATNHDLKYVRASDATGTSWGTPLTLDSTGDVGQYTSLVVVNGNPAISYYDVTNKNLKYIRAGDVSGTSWGNPLILDSTGDVGQFTSMNVVLGTPAICYYDVTNTALKSVRASDASGTVWEPPVGLDGSGTGGGTGSVGQYNSFAILSDGEAAVSYYDATNHDLKWGRSLSPIAALSNLTLSSGTLAPTFASGTFSYTASVSNTTTSITATPTAAQAGASITVNGSAVVSGNASGSIALSVGTNTVTTVVTAQDGTTMLTYTVTVTRLAPPTVTTPTSTAVTATSATLGGNVTSDGSATVTARGVVYAVTSTNSNPQLGGTGVSSATTSGTTGVFTVPVSSLAPGAAYSFAAYATNSEGTGYTSVGAFTTLSNNANLSNLTLSSGTLAPAFASGTLSYTASVSNTTTSITATPTAAQANATITVNGSAVASGNASGSIALSVGPNTITTLVTAQDGTTTQTYTVIVTRQAAPTVTTPTSTAVTATSATLGGNVTSDGGATVTARGVVYAVTATNSNPQLGGTGVANATTSGTTGVFTVPVSSLTPGTAYSFAAYATNSEGSGYSSTGTFTTPSNNASLSNLALSSGTLAPTFASGTSSYIASVPNATASITVTPTAAQTNATITVNGSAVVSGNASGSIALSVGPNTITTLVTAQDGTTTQTYTVIVTRQAAPTVTSPTSTLVSDRSATLGGNVTSDGGAAVTARGVVYAVTATNSNPQLGGTGVINATTTGTTGVFTVHVSSLTPGTAYSFAAYATNSEGTGYTTAGTFTTLSDNDNLANLTLSTGTLAPTFASGTSSYTASVPNTTTSITATPTAAQANATITVNGSAVVSGSASGSIALSVGPNTITTVVTAQDGITTKTYTVIVTRQAAPTVTTPTSTAVAGTSATLGGNVINDGSATVTARGVVYAVTSTNSNPQLGGTGVTNATTSGTTGVFTVPVSSLTPGTAYSFAAYATNSEGTGYTTVGTFTTLSSNASLSNLALSSGTLVPVFASGTSSYTASVPNTTTSLTVTPTAAQANATITVNAVTVASGSASGSIALSVGPNTITTVVTAQDGITTQTYTVIVTRQAAPTVTTPTSTAVTGTSATLGGNVTSDGAATVTARGVVYAVTATNSSPQLGGTGVSNATTSGTTGVFTVPVSSLTPGTAYSFAAYATNSEGTGYSSVGTFTTLSNNANLSNLTLSSGTLVPVFASGTFSYSASVPNTSTSLTATPTAAQANATITVNTVTVASGSASGSIALSVGPNTITTVVTAQDGSTTQIYTVIVTRQAPPTVTTPTSTAVTDDSATLGGNVTSDGAATVTARGVVYAVTATNSNPQLGGTGVSNATTSGTTGVFTLPVSSLTPETAYSFAAYATNSEGTGYSSVGTFTTLSNNANLSNLTLSSGTLAPTFASGTFSYTASVPNTTTSLTVTPTAAQVNATITVNTVTVASGSASGSIALSVGANTITTVVTAQDGTTTQTYTVIVTRQSAPTVTTPTTTAVAGTSATLGGNVTSDGAATVTVRGVVYAVTATNSNPQLGGTGVINATTTGTTGVFTVHVSSLSPDTAYSFAAYATNSQGTGYTTVGTFTTLSSNASLSNLTLSAGTLAPVFASGTFSYTASVSNATTSLTVTPTVAQANATITVNTVTVASGSASGSIALSVGPNTITTVVTAQDGVTTQTYTVIVTRQAAPTVTTPTSAAVASLTATLGGNVASDGGAAVTARGVVYAVTATNSNPQLGGTGVSNATTSGTTGVFTVPVSSLTPGTAYSFAAYATNSEGTGYTTVGTFTTLSNNANLSNLTLSSGTLAPSFAGDTISYTASVSNTTTSLTVTPTAAQASATITVNTATVVSGNASGSIALSVGPNAITTVVTAQDGTTTKTYTVIVTRQAAPTVTTATSTAVTDNSATLGGDVTGDGGATISARGVVYAVTATNSNPQLGGTGVTNATTSGTTGVFTVNVSSLTSETTYSFAAYATNSQGTGYTSVGTFTTLSNNANLASLTLSSGTLEPAFASGTISYTASVSNTTTSLTVTPTVAQVNATIMVNGSAVVSGSASGSIALSVGSNIVTIVVTAQDTPTTKTYTVIVTRQAAPTVTTPTSTAVTATSAILGGNVTGDGGATVTARGVVYAVTATNSNPQLGGTGVGNATTSGTTGVFAVPVSSLTPGTAYSFAAYATNSEGTSYTTVGTFTTPSNNASLSNLALSSGTLVPVFASGTLSYTALVSNATTSLTVTPTAAQANATITVNTITVASGNASGSIALSVGPNTVTTVVTAQDGVTMQTYTVIVTRQAAPTVTTPTSTAVTATSATLGGDVTSDGSATVTARGVVYAVTSTNSDPQLGGTGVSNATTSGTTGVFTVNVSSLTPGTAYSFAAYATNSEGTGYTSVGTFTTLSSNASLSNLTLSSGTLAPTFASGTLSYTALVPNTTASLTVTPTAAQANATITVNTVTVASGNASGSIALSVGPNTITTVVTAQDGITSQTYTVIVTRQAPPTVTTPTSTAVTATSATLGGDVASDGNATVTARGVVYAVTSTNSNPQLGGTGVSSATTSGTTGVFTVNVSSLTPETAYSFAAYATNSQGTGYTSVGTSTTLSSNASLSNLTLSSGTLAPTFASGTLSYTALVSNATTSLTVTPTAAQANATITVNAVTVASGSASGSIALSVGPNTITTVVTAQDGITTQTYAVIVTRDALIPTVTAPTSTAVTSLTATLGGNVTSDGGATVTARGVVYAVTSVNSNPQLGGTGVSNATTTGTTGVFTVPVSALIPDTAYTFAAYATNSQGTGYSSTGTFTTRLNTADLSALSLSVGTLSPVFDSSTISYTAVVPGATTSVTVTPTTTEPTATVQVQVNGGGYASVTSGSPSGSLALNVGSNTVDILVTAEGGLTTRTYTIIITRQAASSVTTPTSTAVTGTSATLGGNVTSDGGAAVTARGVVYAVTATNSNPQIGGTGVTNATTIGTIGVFTVNVSSLTPGTAYSFAAYATNSEGTAYSSTGTFTTLSSNASLANLTLSAGTLAPVFASGTTGYTASVPNTTSSLTVTPTAAQANATITVNTVTVASGNASGSIALSVGPNTVTTVVTAQDGITTQTYTVIVTRQAPPTVTTPTSTAVTAISTTLGGNVTSDGNATVTARGVVYAVTSTNSNPQLGGTGVTNATTTGTTGVFTVNVSSLTPGTAYSFAAYATNSEGTSYTSVGTFTTLSSNASLSNLTLSAGTLAPSFASGTTSYTAVVSNTTTSLTVTPTAAQANATITVNTVTVASGSASGSIALSVGPNTVTTVVTAQDGTTTQIYTVIVTRQAPPTVTTPTSTAVTATSATLGGDVTSDGSATVTARGVVYAVTSTNSNPELGGTGVINATTSGTTGVFTVPVSSLTPGTAYSFAAYATNSEGTGYTSVGTFTTLSSNASLSNLTLSSGTLAPAFASGTLGYTAVVSNTTTSLTVTPTAAQANATITVNTVTVASGSASGSIALSIGPNTITTVVTAQDGVTTQTYTVIVTRQAAPTVTTPTSIAVTDDSATLGGNVTSDGAATVTARGVVYAVTATNSNPQLGGTGVSNATISGTTGVFEVHVGSLTPETAYSFAAYAINSEGTGYSTVGTFTTLSSNANLSNLTLSAGTLAPTFASGTFSYTASVPNTTTSITATPTAAQVNATITVNAVTVASGSASGSIALSVGPNTITTVVTAQDGSTTQIYTVIVTRQAPPTVTTPTSTAVTDDSATLGGNVTSDGAATVTARGVVYAVTSTNSNPQLGGTGVINSPTGGTTGVFAVHVSSLTPETAYSFAAYATNSEGTGYSSVGTFTTLSSNANLSNLTLSSGTLAPSFAGGTFSYTASVPNATTSLTVTPTVAQANATITVNAVTVASGSASGSIALSVGPNTITTVVTAQDGTTTQTYTVTVTRLAAPTVTTPTSTAVASLTAMLSGNVTSDGGTTVTVRGVVYAVTSTNSNPQLGGTGVINATTSGTTGVFEVHIGSLVPETPYSFAAYATNSEGTGYTTVGTFTTLSNNANLSNLALSSGTLAPSFASDTISYTASVPNATTSLTVTPTAAQANATITVNTVTVASGSASGSIALSVGPNTITTVVTAQDGTMTKTYTVLVTRQAAPTVTTPTSTAVTATSATLGGNVTSDGGATVTARGVVYSVTATNSNPQLGGTGVTNATTSGTTGVFTVHVSSLTPETAYSFAAYATNSEGTGYTTVGTFTTPSSNASLSNLTLSSGTLAPTFASGTLSYTASVSNTTTSITVTPTAAQVNATITVNGSAVVSGSASGSIALSVGANTVTTVVIAQDGITTTTYTVTVTRLAQPTVTTPTNTTVTAISATLGGNVTSDGGATISARGVVYAVTATNSNPQLGGTGVSNATTSGTTGVFTVPVSSLTPGTAYSFAAYATNSEGTGYTTVGTFTTPSNNASLSNLALSSGTLVPVFASGTLGYTASVPNTITNITATPTAAQANATITVNTVTVASGSASGSIALSVGPNTITTMVTAQDGTTTQTYTVIVTRQAAPTVTTPTSTAVAATSVTLGGNVTSDGGATVTARGVVYAVTATNSSPQLGGTGVTNATTSGTTGVFTVNVSSLTPGTAYSFAAYATNSEGTGYTTVGSFTTLSSNASLANLTLSSGTLAPTFASGTLGYTASVSNATTSLTVTPTAAQANATITVNTVTVASGSASGSIALSVGPNTITTAVIAQDGITTQTYTVIVTRQAPPTVTTPTSIAVTGDSATLGGDVTSDGGATVTARGVVYAVTATNSNPQIGGTGVTNAPTSGTTGVFDVDVSGLTPGTGYSFTAYASNSQGTGYSSTGTFTTLSNNADLSNFTLSSGTLAPGFASGTTSYTASVPNTTTSLTVTPTAAQANATITVNTVTVASGSASGSIALSVGPNTITTVVTAQDGTTTKTYTVTVTREAAPTVTTPTSTSVTATSATLGGNVTSDGGATVTARGVVYAVTATNSNPQIGGTGVTNAPTIGTTGVFTVNVSGLTPETAYSFAAYATNSEGTGYTSVGTFTTLSNNASLSNLTLSTGTLAPTFASGTLIYTAIVPNTTTSITVSPTLANLAATVQARVNGGLYTSVTSGSPSGSLALNVGGNTVDVMVTAQDGTTTEIYTVTVTRQAAPTVTTPTSTSVTATSATLGGNVTSDGAATVTARGVAYAVTATNSNPQLGGTGVTNATATGTTGVFTVPVSSLTPGTAYSFAGYATNSEGTGYTTVGTFTTPSSNANLSNLALSSGTLVPGFASGTTSYTTVVPGATSILTVTPTLADAAGTVKVRVNGGLYASVTSGSASGALALNMGGNTVDVMVTAQDGTTTQTYTITVTRGIPIVYVDPSFTTPGTLIADADPMTPGAQPAVVGVTAFATISAGVVAVDPAGTVEVNAATYTEDVSTAGKVVTLVSGTGTGEVVINGSLTLDSNATLEVALDGTAPGASYGQWQVSGTVTLGGAALSYSGSYAPITGQVLDVVHNTGVSAISGAFNGLAEGTVISNFMGSTLPAQITYLGGSGHDAMITVLGTSVTPGGQLVITNPPGAGGNCDLTITLVNGGADIQVYDPNNILYAGPGTAQVDPHTITIPFSSVTSGLVFNGTTSGDSFTIDFIGGDPIPLGGMVINGAAGTDILRVVGTGLHAVYTPDAIINGNGVIVFTGVNAGTVTFTGLEPVDFDLPGGTFALSPPSAGNVIDVADGYLLDGVTPALVISGTSGGVGFESARVRGASITIDASGLAGSTDTITLTSADNLHTDTSLTVNTGTDAGDSIAVNGAIAFAGPVSLNATTVTVAAAGSVTTTGAGTLAIGADALTVNASATLSSAVSVSLKQNSNGTLIDLGGANAAGTLGLSDAELDVVTAPTLNIGDVNSGAITVSASITRSSSTAMNVTSGSTIGLNHLLDSAGGNVTFNGTSITPAATGTDVSMGATGTLAFGSGVNLALAIGGTTADSGYTQLNVAGHINLTGATLALSGAYVPGPTDTFTLVNNDGADAITGTFTGLAQGATFAFNGVVMAIRYNAGDGNDVVLSVAPVLNSVTPPADGTYNDSDVLTFTANYSNAMTVNTAGGTPYIGVNIGGTVRHAVYVSGSGTTALVFQYTVTSMDLDSDGIGVISPIVLNGGTIKDASSNDAALVFTPPVTTGVLVDGRVFFTAGAGSDAAPGTVAGGPSVGTWDSIRSGMVIASSGALAFRAHLEMAGGVTALNYQGIWKSPDGTSASTYLLARTGSPALDTGTTNALFDLLPLNPYIDNLGQTTFVGFLRVGTGIGPVTTSSNDSGIWSEQASGGTGPRLLLREGDPVTGGTVTIVAPSGWAGISQPATTSADAYTAFNVQLDGNTSTPGSALLRVTSTTTTVTVATLAKQGDAAPGIGAATGGTFDVMYGNSNDPRMDGAGDVAFLAYLVDSNSGIWYQSVAGSLIAVARTGEATPGLADTFSGFERPSLAANGGHIAFRAFLTTTGQAVWEGDPAVPGGLVAVAKTGDTALPGTPAGSQLWSIWSPFSNASGKVAFRVSLLDGSSVETRAVVTDANGTLGVIAKVGDAAPGTAETFVNFDHPIIGDGNQAAFSASTATVTGIWRQAPGGGALSLVLKAGDTITSNGVSRTVSAFIVVGTASSDRLSEVVSMNAAGQILVWVLYDTGDTGILLTVP